MTNELEAILKENITLIGTDLLYINPYWPYFLQNHSTQRNEFFHLLLVIYIYTQVQYKYTPCLNHCIFSIK